MQTGPKAAMARALFSVSAGREVPVPALLKEGVGVNYWKVDKRKA